MTDRYTVTGMSCAACSARVEKAVSGVEGVTECSVSLLTNSMAVEGTASPDWLRQQVQHMAYLAYMLSSKYTREKVRAAIDDYTG